MVFSLITPGFVGAESNGNSSYSLNDSKQSTSQAKVTSSLTEQFKENDKVTFLIKFGDKADPMKAASKAKAEAEKAKLSAYNQEFKQRSAVISELKATALESQQNVMHYLEQEAEKGNAKDIRSFHIVNGIAVTATKEVAQKVASFAEVEKVLPNEKRQLINATERNVPFKEVEKVTPEEKKKLTKDSAKPENNTQNTEWNVERVGAPDVWSMGFDGTGTVVANIDTGVEWDHPALMEKYAGYDAATGEVDHTYSFFDPVNGETVPYDNDGHGTHTMGTMVGGEDDGSNQIGVAPGAKWIAVQAFTDDGAYDADLLAAAEWILAPGGDASKAPDVVNNSWGGGPGLDEWYRDAVIAWRAADIFPAFAAGNTTLFNPGGPGSVAAPSNYPESFAVGATDSSDNLAEFSLEGPSPYDEVKPDISAPGVAVRSSVPGGGYSSYNGTSMATPAVAGVVALLRDINGNLSVDDLEEILMEHADAEAGTNGTYPDSPNNGFGHGIVDAFTAASAIADGLGTIEGVVTMDGEDTEAPVFEHDAPDEVLSGVELPLSVVVSDNVSVTSVEVSYGGNTLEAEQVSGNHKSGEFAVTIPAEDITGDSFTYQWVINDFGGNEVVSDEYVVTLTEPIFFEDFEVNPEWDIVASGSGEASWEWGQPESGPDSAPSGENLYGTNLSGDYNNNEETYLDLPAIELPEGEAFIQFDHWYDIESNWDYGLLVATNDPAGEWTVLEELTGSSSGWETVAYDLSEFSGDDVYLSFLLETDGSVTYPGWFIDNVTIADIPLIEVSTNGISSTQVVQPSDIPLDATVSVLESGRSTSTNPIDGSYSLTHNAGDFTVVAEAYGYASQEESVSLGADETVQANFTLDELPQATVSGTVTSENSGNPIEGATLLLEEDANVDPVETDENGQFELTGYEGTYTLKVVARDFHSQEIEIDLHEDMTLDIELEPFYTVPGGEIGYDDGTAENARAFYDAGNAWAVKMSLPEGRDSAIVTDGVFQFHGEDWPVPGDTPFAVEVWSAGDDGMPDEKLAGPVDAEAIRDLNEWTVVDLREHNIQVEGDFFMVYVQTQANPNTPGLATDENGTYAERSYERVGGAWGQSPADEGNYMIRARVAYGVDDPVIQSPADGEITNDSNVTVEGTASPSTTVNLLNNGEEVGTAEIGDNGEFAFDVELSEGTNEFTAVSIVNDEEASQSETVAVTLDTQAPELTIDQPTDGDKTNRETVTVEGTIADDHLDTVTVNGQQASVNDGTYSKRIILDEGENVIEVVASDLAGNESTETVTVEADYTAPEIENVTPTEDQNLETGESVQIEFESEEGLRATFAIHMPLTNLGVSNNPSALPMANPTELPMMDMGDGRYVGYWTVPSNLIADGARIEVKVVDEFGNETRQFADGKLFINVDEDDGNNGNGKAKGKQKGNNGKAKGKN
ncbi:S8 family peptidase [Oceanobacillus limi]